MKSIDLKQISTPGLNCCKFFADGKRVTREQFDDIKRRAVRLECLSNASVGGVQTFYSMARLVAS